MKIIYRICTAAIFKIPPKQTHTGVVGLGLTFDQKSVSGSIAISMIKTVLTFLSMNKVSNGSKTFISNYF